MLVVMEPVMVCYRSGCITTKTEYESKMYRDVHLHTILHGTLGIQVVDIKGTDCENFIAYDMVKDAIFCVKCRQALTQ